MTPSPPRRAAPRASPSRAILLAAGLVVHALPLGAQEPATDTPFRAWAIGEASWKITEIAGHRGSLVGGSLGFAVTPRTVVGGAGFRLAGSAPTGPGDEAAARRLDFGYAGVVVERIRRLASDWALTGSVLVGAGHGTVGTADGSLELGADNVGVVELQGGPIWRRPDPLRLSVTAGYRFAFGVQDLPGVSAADLRGVTATISLRLATR